MTSLKNVQPGAEEAKLPYSDCSLFVQLPIGKTYNETGKPAGLKGDDPVPYGILN
jgi:hypothetical protein